MADMRLMDMSCATAGMVLVVGLVGLGAPDLVEATEAPDAGEAEARKTAADSIRASLEQSFEAPDPPKVGTPLELRLRVTHPLKSKVRFEPDLPGTRWELTETRRQSSTNESRRTTTFELTFQVFRAGEATLPSLTIGVERADGTDDTLQTDPVTVTIGSVLADKEAPTFYNVRPPVSIPVEDYTLAWIGGGTLSLALAALALLGWRRRREVDRAADDEERPADVVALETLEAIEEARHLEQGEIMVFYVRVSGAVREYLGRRCRFPGLEWTTAEIVGRLEQADWPDELEYEDVESWFRHVDMVKFSGWHPPTDRAETTLEQAYTIVQATRSVELMPEDDSPSPEADESAEEEPEKSSSDGMDDDTESEASPDEANDDVISNQRAPTNADDEDASEGPTSTDDLDVPDPDEALETEGSTDASTASNDANEGDEAAARADAPSESNSVDRSAGDSVDTRSNVDEDASPDSTTSPDSPDDTTETDDASDDIEDTDDSESAGLFDDAESTDDATAEMNGPSDETEKTAHSEDADLFDDVESAESGSTDAMDDTNDLFDETDDAPDEPSFGSGTSEAEIEATVEDIFADLDHESSSDDSAIDDMEELERDETGLDDISSPEVSEFREADAPSTGGDDEQVGIADEAEEDSPVSPTESSHDESQASDGKGREPSSESPSVDSPWAPGRSGDEPSREEDDDASSPTSDPDDRSPFRGEAEASATAADGASSQTPEPGPDPTESESDDQSDTQNAGASESDDEPDDSAETDSPWAPSPSELEDHLGSEIDHDSSSDDPREETS